MLVKPIAALPYHHLLFELIQHLAVLTSDRCRDLVSYSDFRDSLRCSCHDHVPGFKGEYRRGEGDELRDIVNHIARRAILFDAAIHLFDVNVETDSRLHPAAQADRLTSSTNWTACASGISDTSMKRPKDAKVSRPLHIDQGMPESLACCCTFLAHISRARAETHQIWGYERSNGGLP
jgi:hypothetical protein